MLNPPVRHAYERGVRPDDLAMMRANRDWAEPRTRVAGASDMQMTRGRDRHGRAVPARAGAAAREGRDEGGYAVGDEESDEVPRVRLNRDMASRDAARRCVGCRPRPVGVGRSRGGELAFVDGATAEDAEAACEDV